MGQHLHGRDPHGDSLTHHHGHRDEAGLAELLDLDAEVLGSYLDEVTAWIGLHTLDVPRTVADVGAGTGAGSIALARRFGSADVVAIDRSASMLEHSRTAAIEQGLAERVHAMQADVDVAWPEVGAIDLVWAASSLHEFADPDRVFRDIHAALNRQLERRTVERRRAGFGIILIT